MYLFIYLSQPLQLATICVIFSNPLASAMIYLDRVGTRQRIEQNMTGPNLVHLLSLMTVLVAAISPKMWYCFWFTISAKLCKGEAPVARWSRVPYHS